MKLLIVDDEHIEREAMIAILSRAFPQFQYHQAKNGKQAVEMCHEIQFDLILMDIKMPGITGIEAIRLIQKVISTTFIMVTAFDTFEYAKQALQLGVKDYLLKPSTAKEITETIARVIKGIELDYEKKHQDKKHQWAFEQALTHIETDIVTQLLSDEVQEMHIHMLLEWLQMEIIQETFVVVIRLPDQKLSGYKRVKAQIRGGGIGLVGALHANQFPIIIFRNEQQTYRSQAVNLARAILEQRNQSKDGHWFIGIGTECTSFTELIDSYHEALMASSGPQLTAKYRFYLDVTSLEEKVDNQEGKRTMEILAESVRTGQWAEAKQMIMSLINRYEGKGTSLHHTQQRILEIMWLSTRILADMGIENATPYFSYQTQHYQELRKETIILLEMMQNNYQKHIERLEADTIYKIKQYIIEHSEQDISLETLGRKVNLSPIYISKMFKEKLKMNYIDFLTECRINKAKKMLADIDKSIKEIAIEVGYHDPNYFSKVFKKVCHISPKEYRNRSITSKV
ncbi:response regulator [Alkalihalobacillus pseudalcaliphilus]|uniref:response regulator n=1 Tax=Alkalihalobacillus pseudalcaliphilus TaxID=79884 RepID=UPI0023610A3E|nr:response regulator [Alkalihalobacillus pseudalcaliphilus]